MERQNWLEIDDYIYKSINLDSDEKIIISVIISFTKDGKKFYMSQKSFSETYGMPRATASRKFKSLKDEGIIVETENGLCIDMSELESILKLVKKIKKTRKGGPGRKKKDNHSDSINQNHHDSINEITMILDQNHHDSTQNHHDSINQNHHDSTQNHGDIKKNQGDFQLLKTTKGLPKNIKKEITKEINQKTNFDESFFDDVDLDTKINYKPKLEEPKKDISNDELEEFLASLDI